MITKQIKVIFIHGNSNSTPKDHWFPYLKKELEKLGLLVIARQFPDADLARASYWLPFLKNELKADADTILVGHSSGALAAMRYAEKNKILGSVLVGAMHTDLGIEKEKVSGYFDKPWDWKAIDHNQQWIVQCASTDDPFIPIAEPRFVQQQLDSEYYEFTDYGHFGGDYDKKEFPELVQLIKKKLTPVVEEE
jgi:predicted alpha/beta hydrolase family esterase